MSRDLELLERRLLFVTGKGGVGKTRSPPPSACSPPSQGQAHAASSRSTPRATSPTCFETRAHRVRAPGGRARAVRHVDGHRGVAAGSTSSSSCGSRCWPASARWPRAFDFVATAAPGREGDPHRRQDRVGGQGAPLRPRRGRRLRHRPRGRPARRPGGDQRAGAGRSRPRPDRTGCSTCSPTPSSPARSWWPRPRRCRSPRPSSWSSGCETETDVAARRGGGQQGAARAVRPGRGGGLRPALQPRAAAPQLALGRRRPVDPVLERRRPRGAPAPSRGAEHLDPTAHRARPSTSRCSTCRTCSPAPTACAPPARWPRPSARSSGCTRCATDAGRELERCCGRARSWSPAAPAAWARPPPRRPSARRWPRRTSAARCWCSPSTRPGAWPPRSASSSSATSRRRCRPSCSPPPGCEPRGELWAAMLDTKQSWDDLVPAARARRRDPRRHPGQPALPEHHRQVRAEPRLHRHGAALRDPHARAATT